MENRACSIVSRIPEFVGHDGELYNAAWGPVRITDGGKTVQIGNMCLSGAEVAKLVFVPASVLPRFQPRYFSTDQRMLRIYDATRA